MIIRLLSRSYLGVKLYVIALVAVFMMSFKIDFFKDEKRRDTARKEYEYVFNRKPRF